jgi:murein DD-endopeptidase MepM/ murein hydrolase activator NlpD
MLFLKKNFYSMPKFVQLGRFESGAKQRFYAFRTLTRPLRRVWLQIFSKRTTPPCRGPQGLRYQRWRGAIVGSFVLTLIFSTGLVLSGPARPSAHGSFSSLPADPKLVKITTCRDGDSTHFYVENREHCEITMTFDMGLVNLKGPTDFPYTATFPPGKVTEAFSVSPIDPEAKWEYSYTNYYKLGSSCAQHDDSCVYQLPYAPGRKFKVTQGYNGSFSHKGSNLYAIDWEMPEGTPVYAARGGEVVKVKDDSDTGGSSIKFDKYNNYVLIRHSDGTLGHYCHLKRGGARVEVGQTVRPGDLIAHSGNTGFSSGPHLHFSVYKTKNGRDRESIPVKFRTTDRTAMTLTSGHKYEALSVQTAGTPPPPIAAAAN